jgi:hypothetical protein
MHRHLVVGIVAGILAAVAALVLTNGAQALDDPAYPNLRAQWARFGGGHYDPKEPRTGRSRPPYTDEYRAVALADQANPNGGDQPTSRCSPPGMPRAMLAIEPIEFIVTPTTTYVLLTYFNELRRIHTDGRHFPQQIAPSFIGYSVGRWEGPEGNGRVLTVETRALKGPRVFEGGLPLHADNQTVVKERIYLDPGNPNILHNEITTIDHALTQPWMIKRSYKRDPKPVWVEFLCNEDNHYVTIGDETYFRSAEGQLMPMRRDQPPPRLRGFD